MNSTARVSPHPSMTKTARKLYGRIDAWFHGAAFASFLASVSLWFLVDHQYGLFVGIWVPSILALWAGTRVAHLARRLS